MVIYNTIDDSRTMFVLLFRFEEFDVDSLPVRVEIFV